MQQTEGATRSTARNRSITHQVKCWYNNPFVWSVFSSSLTWYTTTESWIVAYPPVILLSFSAGISTECIKRGDKKIWSCWVSLESQTGSSQGQPISLWSIPNWLQELPPAVPEVGSCPGGLVNSKDGWKFLVNAIEWTCWNVTVEDLLSPFQFTLHFSCRDITWGHSHHNWDTDSVVESRLFYHCQARVCSFSKKSQRFPCKLQELRQQRRQVQEELDKAAD